MAIMGVVVAPNPISNVEFQVPPWILEESADTAPPAWSALLAYVRGNVLLAPSEEVRDRVGRLLLDESYHSLMAQVAAAVRPTASAKSTRTHSFHIPAALKEKYALAMRTDEVMRQVGRDRVAKTSPSEAKAPKATVFSAKERVAEIRQLVYMPMPSAIKRGVLGGYVATICNVALYSNTDGGAAAETFDEILNQFLDAVRSQLAVAQSYGWADVDEELLPVSYRFVATDEVRRYHEGLARSAQRKPTR